MMTIPRQKPSLPDGTLTIFFQLLLKGELLDGSYPLAFEKKLAAFIGTGDAVLVSSGRLALYIIMEYFGIGEGDEIILPSYTCPVVPSVIVAKGATPVFVDVSPDTFNMDPLLVEKAVTERTRAIVATHIEGQPCDMENIARIAKKHDLKIIEDGAQALGSEYKSRKIGTLGDVSYFSFALGKQVNTGGGGFVLTDDKKLVTYIRDKLKSYKQQKPSALIKKFLFMYIVHMFTKPLLFAFFVYPFIFIGNLMGKDIINLLYEDKGYLKKFNSRYGVRYSNLQAAIGLRRLEALERENQQRIKNADILNRHLAHGIKRQEGIGEDCSICLYYSVIVNDRTTLKRRLLRHGIDTQESWNVSCAALELFKRYKRSCPVSCGLKKTALYLPNYPGLSEKQVVHIAETVNRALRKS
jgi:dTDP-4-amino-4,6-dideoxygalactose transaminase